MAVSLTAKEAVEHVRDHFGVTSLYQMAKSLSDKEMTVQPTQVQNWLDGKKMSERVAQRMLDTYDIIITDVYAPGKLRKKK